MYVSVVSSSYYLPKKLKGSGERYSSSYVTVTTYYVLFKSEYCCAKRYAKVMLKITLNCLPANSISLKNLENTHVSQTLVADLPTAWLTTCRKVHKKGILAFAQNLHFQSSASLYLSQLCSQRKDLPNDCCGVPQLIGFYADIFQHKKIYKVSYYYCSGGGLFMLLLRTLMDFFQFGNRKSLA